MAAPYNPPIKGEEFKIRVALDDMSNYGSFKINPTIASGDFQVDKDGGGFNNLTTTPSVSPAGTQCVFIELSASEMAADIVTIRAVDQTSPKEWGDLVLSIPTASA